MYIHESATPSLCLRREKEAQGKDGSSGEQKREGKHTPPTLTLTQTNSPFTLPNPHINVLANSKLGPANPTLLAPCSALNPIGLSI